jgi:hypothetical protein
MTDATLAAAVDRLFDSFGSTNGIPVRDATGNFTPAAIAGVITNLAGQLRRLQEDAVPIVTNDVLDPSLWKEQITSPAAVPMALQVFRVQFKDALSGRKSFTCDNLMSALASNLYLLAQHPGLGENTHFLSGNRVLIAELFAEQQHCKGAKPGAVGALRQCLTDSELPANIKDALSHAKLMEKLSTSDSFSGHSRNTSQRNQPAKRQKRQAPQGGQPASNQQQQQQRPAQPRAER